MLPLWSICTTVPNMTQLFFSPYFLLFRREHRLLIGLLLPCPETAGAKTFGGYIEGLKEQWEHAHQLVQT